MKHVKTRPRLIETPKGHKRLAAYIIAHLKPVAETGSVEELCRAANQLLDILQGRPKRSYVWCDQGITEWNQCKVVEYKGVAYVFKGTTVPIDWLFQDFEKGKSVPQFLAEHPEVTPNQVAIILEHIVLTLCS